MSDQLFSKIILSQVLRNHHGMAQKEIDSCNEDYLLNASETDLVAYVVSKVSLAVPQLGEPFMLEPTEVEIEVAHDPMRDRSYGKSMKVRGCRVEVHIPFTGDRDLFDCRPSRFTFNAPRATVGHDRLVLIFDQPGPLNSEEVKRNYEQTLKQIGEFLQHVEVDCDKFHADLEPQVCRMLTDRKSRILQNRQAGLGIGIPLKRRTDTSRTYSVAGVVRKPQIQRPAVKEKSFAPEPILVETEYEYILEIIRSMVSVMERSPKAFIGMGEEDLRTQFLVQLNGQYQGRVTGETFNYNGKTDILIREDDRNVFIAECKIWKGEGELIKAIDQILNYLHWRDTKTALMVFNRNKSFSDVLSKIVPAVQGHKCCKRLIEKHGETEWRFLFHNPDDSNRELQMAVMLFDIPKDAV
jgi:hypothetical protein